jgi:hypothetical protein
LFLQQLGKLRAETRKREAYLKEKEEFYNSEVANNKETEKKIELTERLNFKLKQEYQEMEKERDRFSSEVCYQYFYVGKNRYSPPRDIFIIFNE